MKEFDCAAYQEVVYINFDANAQMVTLVADNLDVTRIVTRMKLYDGKKIDPDTTSLIFDEIQEVPKALSSLKYFTKMYQNTILFV